MGGLEIRDVLTKPGFVRPWSWTALLLKSGVRVEKPCDRTDLVRAVGADIAEFFFSSLGGNSQRCGWRTEEAHQSLDVLRRRR